MNKIKNRAGIAIVSSLIFLVIVVAMVGLGTLLGVSNYRLSAESKMTIQAQHAADAAIERAIYEFWHIPQKYIQNTSLPVSSSNLKRVLNGDIYLDGNISNEIILAGVDATYGNSVTLSGILDNESAYEAIVQRRDVGNNILLNIVAKGTMGSAKRYISQTLSFGNANPWDFALLTDKVQCIFCHVEIYSIEAGYKPDGTLRNFFTEDLSDIHGMKRVRVGSLSDMTLNGDKTLEADTYILGTVYTREGSNFVPDKAEVYGAALQPNLPLIKADRNSGNNTFNDVFQKYSDWDNEGGYMECNSDLCTAYGNHYTHYPNEDQPQPDGLLQTTFPLPVNDGNYDRIISDNEWNTAASSGGSISVASPNAKNAILTTATAAGIIKVMHGNTLSNGSVTSTFNSETTFDGEHHVVLRGTANKPLEINGKVYVNGDVVISGRISGNGMIIARGNAYIVGDVVYDCGSSDCDYTKPNTLPTFALSAVGSIISGLATTPSLGSSQYQTSPQPLSTQLSFYEADGVTINSRFYEQDYGMVARYDLSDEWKHRGNALTLSASQLYDFNHGEYERAVADTSYIPRLYILRQGEHDWVQRCNGCSDYQGSWTPFPMTTNLASRHLDGSVFINDSIDSPIAGGATLGQPIFGIAQWPSVTPEDSDVLQRAVYMSLSPADHWTLDAYGITEAPFNTQFPSSTCTDAEVNNYIDTTLFSLKLQNNGTQEKGQVRSNNDPMSATHTCYDIAVARERLRAMNAELSLREMWKTYMEDNNVRDDIINPSVDGDSFRFDGIIYTGSAFFFMSPRKSAAAGEAVVNGSFIAGDMGVLVPGSKTIRGVDTHMHSDNDEQNARGLRIQYDSRPIQLISDIGEGVSLSRSGFETLTSSKAKSYFDGTTP